MRVIAILAAYNEERYIGACLEHLARQGVEAYLIDNGSTDRTVEIAERYLGRNLVGIESFPREGGVYRWRPILERKEELAATLDADWFLHADPDEIRLPPRPDRTLAGALAEADARGYDAVNFIEYTFVPTKEAPDHDHPNFQETMGHYYPFMHNFPYRVNAWKRQPERVSLAHSGGHRVSFPGQILYPESFKMRHYPYLSVPHVVSKYIEKVYDAGELQSGWHNFRSRVVEEKIKFPSQAELNVYTTDEELDFSNPRVRHVASYWSLSREGPEHAAAPSAVPGTL